MPKPKPTPKPKFSEKQDKQLANMRGATTGSTRQAADSMAHGKVSLTDQNRIAREANHANAEAARHAQFNQTPVGQFQQRMQQQAAVPNIFAPPVQPMAAPAPAPAAGTPPAPAPQPVQPMAQTSSYTPQDPNQYAARLRQQAMSHISKILNPYAEFQQNG